MRRLVQIFVVLTAIAGLMGVMSGTAIAAMPGNGAYQHANDMEELDEALVNCVASGACTEALDDEPATDAGDEEYPVEPDNPVDDGDEGIQDEPPVDEDTPPEENIVPDTPEVTDDTPEQPPVTTQETPVPTTSSKLPNTGSSLALVAAIGAVLIAAALGARVLMTRRSR